MNTIEEKISSADWQRVTEDMHERGYAIIENMLTEKDCAELISGYQHPDSYRKTVVMERYRFGIGEYKYFNYPLPALIQTIRTAVYSHLAPIANTWMRVLQIGKQYPLVHEEFLSLCAEQQQTKATVLILKYGQGGFNTLHQDLYGDLYFPIQLVLFLNEPGRDYEGGEFVLTQQNPRAQSKAIVLKPRKGSMLLFTTNFRPSKGSKGYYQMKMKHGVSEVHQGERYAVGVIFHDALT
ncbi:prolyl 4-hydroxylase subunit alpha [Pedobacter lusitanus]|uniref:Prolyl 4-hydroxylase subunit alpha n=1 Tax=Pedobacter lusitanus TaxID=1503925 RepID=A0A0D0GT84_9SPHI|nr:2OG-Fe(II) oxygenase [Pedobacter lusitanus]KIO77691.1 prolyl 4-hydroxylase subunit alpha [Pedobacter lusitanus]